MTVTSTPVWHDIFRKVTLKPDNITLEAEKYDDTLNIIRGPGVAWGADTTTDTFSILVDYNLTIPAATTKISLEDINGNLSEIELSAGRGVAINRISAHELQIESFSVTETDTLHSVTLRNNITTNTIFVNNIEVGTIASNTSEDGFLSFDAGHNLIGDGTLGNTLRFSPLYQDSLAANNTDQFEFTAAGPGTLAYAANYVADVTLATGSVTLEREDPLNPGNWIVLDIQSGTTAGFAYFIDGTYSELYSGTVTYRLTYAWTGNTGTVTWYTNNTFEAGAYTPINNPQIKTDTNAKTVDINDIQFFQNTIRTLSSNADVVFDLSGTGQVRILGNITADRLFGNVTGNLTGNADTVTNGVYTTGSYSNPSWITNLDGTKVTNAVLTTGSYSNPNWITSLDASKIVGSIGLSDITIDGSIRIYDNVIETVISNADLELRANGTGIVSITDGLTVSNTLTANSTVSMSPANATITMSPTGTGTVTINPTTAGTINNMSIGVSTRAAGNFTTLDANNVVGLSPANQNVTISPTGTGTVTINPATAGNINNMTIGNSTRAAGNFTDLDANGNVTLGSDSADSITVNGTLANATQFRAGTSAGNTFTLAGYDTNTGPAWKNLITITSGIAPTVAISSDGTGSIDNMTIGATTASTGRFTTLKVRDTTTTNFDLFFASNSSTALSADRTLTFDVVNASRTIKLTGNIDIAGNLTTANAFTTSGNFALTLTTTNTTSVTLPTSGTLYGTATGSITSSQLATSLSDGTGSGAAVFGTNPTLASPTYGNASSTSDADATVDAATTSFYAYIQSATTTTRNINISNLIAGRVITLYLRNTNAGTKTINILASTTTTGFAAVNLSIGGSGSGAVGQASATSVTLAATSGTAMVTVFNANATFGGSIS